MSEVFWKTWFVKSSLKKILQRPLPDFIDKITDSVLTNEQVIEQIEKVADYASKNYFYFSKENFLQDMESFYRMEGRQMFLNYEKHYDYLMDFQTTEICYPEKMNVLQVVGLMVNEVVLIVSDITDLKPSYSRMLCFIAFNDFVDESRFKFLKKPNLPLDEYKNFLIQKCDFLKWKAEKELEHVSFNNNNTMFNIVSSIIQIESKDLKQSFKKMVLQSLQDSNLKKSEFWEELLFLNNCYDYILSCISEHFSYAHSFPPTSALKHPIRSIAYYVGKKAHNFIFVSEINFLIGVFNVVRSKKLEFKEFNSNLPKNCYEVRSESSIENYLKKIEMENSVEIIKIDEPHFCNSSRPILSPCNNLCLPPTVFFFDFYKTFVENFKIFNQLPFNEYHNFQKALDNFSDLCHEINELYFVDYEYFTNLMDECKKKIFPNLKKSKLEFVLHNSSETIEIENIVNALKEDEVFKKLPTCKIWFDNLFSKLNKICSLLNFKPFVTISEFKESYSSILLQCLLNEYPKIGQFLHSNDGCSMFGQCLFKKSKQVKNIIACENISFENLTTNLHNKHVMRVFKNYKETLISTNVANQNCKTINISPDLLSEAEFQQAIKIADKKFKIVLVTPLSKTQRKKQKYNQKLAEKKNQCDELATEQIATGQILTTDETPKEVLSPSCSPKKDNSIKVEEKHPGEENNEKQKEKIKPFQKVNKPELKKKENISKAPAFTVIIEPKKKHTLNNDDIETLADKIIENIDKLLAKLPKDASDISIFTKVCSNELDDELDYIDKDCLKVLVNGKKSFFKVFKLKMKDIIEFKFEKKRRIFIKPKQLKSVPPNTNFKCESSSEFKPTLSKSNGCGNNESISEKLLMTLKEKEALQARLNRFEEDNRNLQTKINTSVNEFSKKERSFKQGSKQREGQINHLENELKKAKIRIRSLEDENLLNQDEFNEINANNLEKIEKLIKASKFFAISNSKKIDGYENILKQLNYKGPICYICWKTNVGNVYKCKFCSVELHEDCLVKRHEKNNKCPFCEDVIEFSIEI